MSCNRDLTLDEALADPMIAAALRADRVDPRRFEALLRGTARRRSTLPRRPRAPPRAPAQLRRGDQLRSAAVPPRRLHAW